MPAPAQDDPAQISESLKAESDRQLHVDPEQALRIAHQIGDLARTASDSSIRALGHLAEADALRELGRYGDALAAYGAAAAGYDELGDEVGWARSRIGATVTWRYTGVTADNLAEINRARSILVRRGLWLRLARLEQHFGQLLCELGRLDEATQAFERALDAARRLESRDPAQEARILGNLALVWQRLGEYERADGHLAIALSVFLEHGHARELAVGKAITAQLLADQGHYSRALEMAVSARRSFHELGQLVDAAFVGRVGAFCFVALNQYEAAIELASDVAGEFETAHAAINQAATLLLRSGALRRQGRVDEALADLDCAERVFAASECRGWVAIVRGERASMLGSMGAWDAAAVESRAAAQELSATGQVISGAQASLVHASALQAMGEKDTARDVVHEVLTAVQGRGVPWLEHQAWRFAAELALADRHPARALKAFDASIRALEQVQGRILTEARADYLADKLDVFEAAVGLCLERADDARAFEYAERAKSRALVDALAGRLDIRIRPRTAQEERLANEFRRLRRRHDQISAIGSSALAHAEANPPAFPVEELEACERQIVALLDELRLANVADLERVALLQGRVYPLQLDESTRLVEYFSVADDLCVFIGSPPDVKGYRLAGARSRVDRLATLLHMTLQTTASIRRDARRMEALETTVRKLLARLYTELVAPFATLLDGVARLVVVPHGVLHRIPFAALHDGSAYLIERHEVVVGPSASALAFCRRAPAQSKRRGVVLGHSDNGNLHGARREAERIASLLQVPCLLEADATRARLVEHARDADVVHLATHGYARVDAPLFSYVRLADGNLTALDCFELELDSALVTLSACESGWARIVPGDEQMGLPRAFLYAGARSVLQTLWRVDDDSTSQLMERFYRELQAGRRRSQALQCAQLELLRDTPGRSHPFFWAPTVLVGDWGEIPNLALLRAKRAQRAQRAQRVEREE